MDLVPATFTTDEAEGLSHNLFSLKLLAFSALRTDYSLGNISAQQSIYTEIFLFTKQVLFKAFMTIYCEISKYLCHHHLPHQRFDNVMKIILFCFFKNELYEVFLMEFHIQILRLFIYCMRMSRNVSSFCFSVSNVNYIIGSCKHASLFEFIHGDNANCRRYS